MSNNSTRLDDASNKVRDSRKLYEDALSDASKFLGDKSPDSGSEREALNYQSNVMRHMKKAESEKLKFDLSWQDYFHEVNMSHLRSQRRQTCGIIILTAVIALATAVQAYKICYPPAVASGDHARMSDDGSRHGIARPSSTVKVVESRSAVKHSDGAEVGPANLHDAATRPPTLDSTPADP